MAGNWNHVFWAEDVRLVQNLASNFGQRKAISCRIKILETAGILNRLKCHAANTGLLECKINCLADFVIVQSFLKCDHEIGGDVVPVQPFEGIQANAPKVRATKLYQRLAFERI